MKSFWYRTTNFGDTLTPIVIEYILGEKPEHTDKEDTKKILAIGSILKFIKDGDIVWGAGLNEPIKIKAPKGSKFLAVRGPITKSFIDPEKVVPEIYGDPSILIPLIYNPKIEKTHEIGLLPHYEDKTLVKPKNGEKLIDIEADWKTVINDILSCKKIIASSLHGIICAEVYGIPAEWAVYSDKVVGGEMKYQDYFLGSGREKQKPFQKIPLIKDLEQKQNILIKALKDYYIR
ncbi:MAG: polysaccharide pyruvyl transferase family protein [bacterium]